MVVVVVMVEEVVMMVVVVMVEVIVVMMVVVVMMVEVSCGCKDTHEHTGIPMALACAKSNGCNTRMRFKTENTLQRD